MKAGVPSEVLSSAPAKLTKPTLATVSKVIRLSCYSNTEPRSAGDWAKHDTFQDKPLWKVQSRFAPDVPVGSTTPNRSPRPQSPDSHQLEINVFHAGAFSRKANTRLCTPLRFNLDTKRAKEAGQHSRSSALKSAEELERNCSFV
jgi:hypothetical protein